MNKVVYYISGSSGVGKNTIISNVVKGRTDIGYLISYTTRPMRPYEKQDSPYHFVSREEFEELIKENKILEFDFFNGNYYGHCKDSIDKQLLSHSAVIKDLTVGGVRQTKEKLTDYKLVTIFLTEKKSELKRRLIGRGEKDWRNRLKEYNHEQREMKNYDYIVKNSDLDTSIKVVTKIIDKENDGKTIYTNIPCDRVNLNKIVKLEDKILKGGRVSPIVLSLKGDNFYITKGINTYLASKKCGKSVPKQILTRDFNVNSQIDQSEWEKIEKSFRKDN